MMVIRLMTIATLCATACNPVKPKEVAEVPVTRTEWQWKELDGTIARPDAKVAFSSNGSLLAAGSGDTIYVWAADTGKPVARMKLPQANPIHRLAFSSDGNTLVSEWRDDPFIRFWDVKTGKQRHEVAQPRSPMKLPANYNSYTFKAFSPTGDILVGDVHASAEHFELQVIDLATMKPRSSIKQAIYDHDHWAELAFTADGKSFAVNGPQSQLRIFSTATGELIREFRSADKPSPGRTYRGFVHFSPDSNYLMAQEHTGRIERFDVWRFVIWGVKDGRQYWAEEKQGGWMSADNRYLVRDHRSVLDLLTDRTVPIENAPMQARHFVGSSSDGKTLAFLGPGSAPGIGASRPLSIFLTPAPVLPQPDDFAGRDVPPIDLDFTWSGVVADNLFRRERSARILAAHPGQALGMAREKLKPVPAADRERVAELIVKLDDDSADVRDKATADLQQVAHRFEPMLANALKDAKPGEVKNRLTAVIKKMKDSNSPADLVAELRGMEFLETLRAPEARKLMGALANGAPGASLTVAATAAMKRLNLLRP